MRCPHCGSDDYCTLKDSHRWRRKSVEGAFVRCHQCQDCGRKFVSRQSAVIGEAAADLLAAMSE